MHMYIKVLKLTHETIYNIIMYMFSRYEMYVYYTGLVSSSVLEGSMATTASGSAENQPLTQNYSYRHRHIL